MRILTYLMAAVLMTLPALADGVQQRPGWVVIDTDQPYSELVDSLNQAVKDEKMGLVTRASATVGAARENIEIPGNMVVGVYRNDYARRMLEASLAAGIEAPIRFYLTENADGTSTLSYRTPSAVFAPYFDEGGDALKALAGELDAVFSKIAERASGKAP